MSRIFVVALIIFSSLLLHRSQSVDSAKDAATLSKEAYELITKNEYAAAIEKAELAIRKDPNFGEAHKNLALAYCDSGRVEEALDPAQKGVRLSPDFDKAHYVLAKIFFKLGRFSEAITECEAAVRINPKYDKAYFLLGRSYDLSNKSEEARAALDHAAQLKPDEYIYGLLRDCVVAYAAQRKASASIPTIVGAKGNISQRDMHVYGGIFYEALIHRDFDLIDRAANTARISKEKLPGGTWKLQQVYTLIRSPLYPTSDYDWNQHLSLLQQWAQAKPDSQTAKVALAASYVSFAWNARGTGYANTVSPENWKLFDMRLARAKEILLSARGPKVCPRWYSEMLAIALGQSWDRESYEKLFIEAIKNEPTWYEYYTQKLVALLPQWSLQPEASNAYIDSFALEQDDADNAIIYFLLEESTTYYDRDRAAKPVANYPAFKKGFLNLKKTYGVTAEDVNWACAKAVQAGDSSFAAELFPTLKGDPNLQVWKGQKLTGWD